AENTAKFKKQLSQMGFSYDWSREINSSDPDYYKWTQWFFLMLLERGLAYQKDSLQWWCDTDKTVLANEQVEAGKCWRCGNAVVKKPLKQWFFKITDYADRLVADLDDLDWSDAIKTMQRNWIGRSVGAEVEFTVADSDQKITVFTTRPDTLFGATFMVLAPEHPLVQQITTPDQRTAVDDYVKQAAAKTDVERQENKEKTGVFTGAYAVNPVNNSKIPIWIADYVLMGYGTGAIMAVPAHDERDQAFAVAHELPITPVIAPTFMPTDGEPDTKLATDRPAILNVAYDPKTQKYCLIDWVNHPHRQLEWPGGGIDAGETDQQGALREFTEETGYTDASVDQVLPYSAAMYFINGKGEHKRNVFKAAKLTVHSDTHNGVVGTEDYEKEAYKVLWLTKDEIMSRIDQMVGQYRVLAEYIFSGIIFSGKEGTLVNSGDYDNLPASEAREKIVKDLAAKGQAKEVTNYKIRDWLISRQRYWGAPIPVIHCDKCGAQPVPKDQLPVKLPEVKSYQPTGEGTSVLASVHDWVNVKCPKCQGPAKRETDTMDGFACSSWYFLRFADPHNNKEPFAKEKEDYWCPVDDYIGGAEHAVMHLLYARMWTKVMFDAGMIDFNEPFTALRNHGMILAPDGRKMSKSWGNTITPDEIIEQGYGADAIRVMELFIGPWDQKANWSVEGMGGCFRFLQRAWTITQEFVAGQDGENPQTAALKKATHTAIKKVSQDMQDMGFNTSVASLMELVNELYKIKAAEKGFAERAAWQEALENLLLLLAPFAPHITEELWHDLGHKESIHLANWPVFDPALLVEDTVTYAIQVNGKLRGEVSVAADADKDSVAAAAQEKVASHLDGLAIKKTIVVPGKIVNFVVS
ncbi:MAG TPA: class I tRNA ligase family protein, partial [Candidatus Saccharibacteria bacterium]|nr:class I tRNA ligase family protein [Candidatus Saccharibacteria bacterium]